MSIISTADIFLCIGGVFTLALLVVLTLAFTNQKGPFRPANEPPHTPKKEVFSARVEDPKKSG